jgi:hypothetical protein
MMGQKNLLLLLTTNLEKNPLSFLMGIFEYVKSYETIFVNERQ